MNNDLIKKIIKFRDDRDWKKFHSGENLAKSISIEAGELLELFQWSHEEKNIERIKEELADVLMYSILMANVYNLNIEEIINEKIEKNSKKYPIDKAFGNSKKYNEYK